MHIFFINNIQNGNPGSWCLLYFMGSGVNLILKIHNMHVSHDT